MTPNTYMANLAHITAAGNIFQILNADGTDWSEPATAQAYQAWQANTPGGIANTTVSTVSNTVVANTVTSVVKP